MAVNSAGDAHARCNSLAPNADVAEKCCANFNRSALHVGLLSQLAKVDGANVDDAFAHLAVRNTIRRVGLQGPMKKKHFGVESEHVLDMELGRQKGSGVRTDVHRGAYKRARGGEESVLLKASPPRAPASESPPRA